MENNDKNKKQAPKSIVDFLKMDGVGDTKFDEDESQKELERLEARKKMLIDYKAKIKDYGNLGNDDYKMKVLKEMVETGLTMMETMRCELEENPRGADVEYVASLMNSINNLIDSISKMDFFKVKVELEREKLKTKQDLLTGSSAGGTTNIQNNFYTTAEIIKMARNPESYEKEVTSIDVKESE